MILKFKKILTKCIDLLLPKTTFELMAIQKFRKIKKNPLKFNTTKEIFLFVKILKIIQRFNALRKEIQFRMVEALNRYKALRFQKQFLQIF